MSSVLERFLRYVQIDTQSDPNSETFPSTAKQRNLSNLLAEELRALGVADAHVDEHGYVYATIPSNSERTDIPVICFCSHVDTSPDVTGENVKPIVHRNWDGSHIILPDDHSQVLRVGELHDLDQQIGNDIVTASGTTLLGADNKAGVAEIMAAAEYLLANPQIKHGDIKILFTPDEEVGRGTEKVDLQKLGADFGYTVDGEAIGTLEDETFSADGVKITIHGVSTHPGYAIGKLENALKIVAEILARLPKDKLSPETTQDKEGFIHPVQMEGIQEKAVLSFIIRDFTVAGLHEKEAFLKGIMEEVLKGYPNSSAEFKVQEQYRNMKEVLDQHPEVIQNALTAMERVGLNPIQRSIRGGTDGSRLSFMGLPCPNIFAGEHAFHSKLEWVSVQDMEKAVDVIVSLAGVWAEK
ncbi:tripeptide aminopeptidase [Dyadobacter sp. BE34]|uniref:Peptidase T n=1 Tax=Dyadobacter fermentans TaxID=94254 RepID=A0ABU1QSY7_9BACT|nr:MULTISPECIES: peptidase T [Dyadobacter]MDR6804122.1 tripeptide aminopeptidase [Dyadobacter fermentans]MDR7041862.1 tripeptide aminopeptidase [Dyadobacter sp. BE242]MDR7196265.1 tripeptide aminopeptidase [Dyadobacter sp. BE34]MDR7213190.1 tripeptide aminopeptidase [Dyadobacter sp. BE31]MDR7261671.1 tripeptide aminopeptidase [Dyadobacter sp. BE32]